MSLAVLPFLLLAAPTISGEVVCGVQYAIKHRNKAWAPERCEAVAAAVRATFAPQLVFAIAVNESDLRETATRRARQGVYDIGLMGVRCRLAAGRCTNGPARGHTLADLQDPIINIQVGTRILEQKKRRSPRHYLRHYNGGTHNHGYAERVHAIRVALEGRRVHLDDPRVNKLTQQIVEALQE
jgi:soluble lytic murein transglycosylase-like protein